MRMSQLHFDTLLQRRLAAIQSTLGSKAKEYANDADRMHNFNRALEVSPQYKTREDAIYGMALKHWVSILDIFDGIRNGQKYEEAYIIEKFGDWINYMLLTEISIIQTSINPT